MTTESKTYNGWTNYETWLTKLWIDNDGSDSYWNERAEETWSDTEKSDRFTHAEEAAFQLSKQLEEEIKNADELPTTGLYADLLNAALSEVNWHEIAKAFIEDNDLREDNDETNDE